MQSIGGLPVHILTGYMLFVGMTAVATCQSIAQKQKADWTKIILITVLQGTHDERIPIGSWQTTSL